ncbi:LPS export ABC transporter permease LptG [Acidocella sp.]|uniref:LPS export ABC transporter permease LptG n=1 Tax=Acidocella sp. TaxID=50710 RepID=UPI00263100FE|nr:LPS export ABC transporter permease LptG [Acidocella sp.]
MTLERYLGGLTARLFVLMAAGITGLVSLFGFVAQLSLVGKGGYHVTDALLNTLLTAPGRFVTLSPVALLLACLLALGGLSRWSELQAFQALGHPPARLIGAQARLVLPLTLLVLALAQFVVPAAQFIAQTHQAQALGPGAPELANGGFWAEHGGQYLNVGRFDYDNTPQQIDIYAFTPEGRLTTALHAKRATIAPDGTWTLVQVRETTITPTGALATTYHDTQGWTPFLSTRQMRLLSLPPAALSPLSLIRFIRAGQQQGAEVSRYEQSLWALLSLPPSALAMVLIAAPFGFGRPRQTNAGRPLFIGALIGLGFELTQQLITQTGERLALPAPLTALLPSALLLLLALRLLSRQQAQLTRHRARSVKHLAGWSDTSQP